MPVGTGETETDGEIVAAAELDAADDGVAAGEPPWLSVRVGVCEGVGARVCVALAATPVSVQYPPTLLNLRKHNEGDVKEAGACTTHQHEVRWYRARAWKHNYTARCARRSG